MKQNYLPAALIAAACLLATPETARADLGNLTIKDGSGEEITIKRGIFGNETRVVKDRLGNGYESKKGIFGSKEQKVSVLGNQVKRKKGWFGRDKVEASSILGDSIKSEKGFFGRRNTTVDVSGVTGLVKQLMGDKKPIKNVNAPIPNDWETMPLRKDQDVEKSSLGGDTTAGTSGQQSALSGSTPQ